MFLQKVKSKKNLGKFFVVDVFKVTDDNSRNRIRIRIRIRIH
jgi:hypothetical protein